MQKEKYLIIPRSKNIEEYLPSGFNSFILPLENYSIGYDTYFSVEEINKLSKKYNIFVMVNKLLHRKIDDFRKIYNSFNDNIMFFVEDIGLTDVISKDRIILYENHMLANYKAVNYLNTLGITNVVLNNELTINEISEIRSKTTSKLYFFYITRNMLLYSRRTLLSNYKKHYNIKDNDSKCVVVEKVSKTLLEVNEEDDSTTIRMRKLFSGNKYIDELKKLDYLIIDTNSMSDLELKVVLEYYDNSELINVLDVDYYFLENSIKYKVGDINEI